MRCNPSWTRVFGLAVTVSIASCGTPPLAPPAVPNSTIVQPTRAIHLRAAFDDDPTAYVGRFVPGTLAGAELDETAAAQTRCSEHFIHKVVSSNQELDEIAYTSTKVAGSLGAKPFAALSGSTERAATLRVKYTLKKRMQVLVKDPAALARCCASAPDQCSNTVIGEFLMGSGEVYQMAGSQAELAASGMAKSVTGDLSFKDGVGWKRVNTFKDMYFAFLTTAAQIPPSAAPDDGSCGFCDNIPTSLDGTYFCGVSPPAPSEAMARDLAMRNAREQVVKFVGELLSTQASSEASLVKGYLEDKQVTTAAASGLAANVKDTRWCKAAPTSTPEGVKYTSKVLAFLAHADKKQAAQLVVDAMLAAGGAGEKADGPKDKGASKDKSKVSKDALRRLKEKVK
jgi:hypothetical protein